MDFQDTTHAEGRYGLSYHLDICSRAVERVGLSGKAVLEVGGSLPREYVLGELGAKSWTSIEELGYYDAIGEAQYLYKNIDDDTKRQCIPLGKLTGFSDLTDYTILSGRIENIPEFLYDRFDVVISLAAFEHIDRFHMALSKMYRALKKGGALYTEFGPIWSGPNGHHLHGVTDAKGRTFSFTDTIVPRWGHLLMRPPELLAELLTHTDEATAAEIVYQVYNSPSINRLFTEDYVDFIRMSEFSIEMLAKWGIVPVPEEVNRKLSFLYPTREHFDNVGMVALLRR